MIEISKTEALTALRAASWPRPEDDEDRAGQPAVHRRGSFTGADIDLAGAEQDIENAVKVGWVDDLFSHELIAVMPTGRMWTYEVSRERHGAAEAQR